MSSFKQIHFWQKPAYLPYVQPALTDAALAAAEAQIGYRLPAEMVALLRIQNGGYTRYRFPNTPNEILQGIGPFFPSLTDFDWTEEAEYVSFPLAGLVPFDGDGHWYLCLDYRNNKDNPCVSYIDTECDEEGVVADSFAHYLAQLKPDIAGQRVVETADSINTFARRLEGLLNITFEDPDYFNQGYAIYRSVYEKGWLWLTPNEVPDGFVRESEGRYEALKAQIKGTALRYPELPPQALLLELSEEEGYAEFAGRLREAGIESVPIGGFIG